MPIFVATISVSGRSLRYDEEFPTFETTRGAWYYLADERKAAEDAAAADIGGEVIEYSDTLRQLRQNAGTGLAAAKNVWPGGTGTVWGMSCHPHRMDKILLDYSVTTVIE